MEAALTTYKMPKKKIKKIIFKLVVIITSVLIISNVGGICAYESILSRKDVDPDFISLFHTFENQYEINSMSINMDDYALNSYYIKNKEEKGLVIFSSGLNSSAYYLIPYQDYLYKNGYSIFAYDASGCNLSGGKQEDFGKSINDLYTVLNFIDNNNNIDSEKKLLFGFSRGGYASASIFALYKETICASVSISAYNDPNKLFAHVTTHYGSFLSNIGLLLTNQIHRNKYPLSVNALNQTETPVLIVHGTKDKTVNYKKDSIISKKDDITNDNVQLCAIEDKGHTSILFSNQALELQKNKNSDDLFAKYEIDQYLASTILSFYNDCVQY